MLVISLEHYFICCEYISYQYMCNNDGDGDNDEVEEGWVDRSG